MKYLFSPLALLLVGLLILPNHAQSQKKSTKTKTVKPTKPDNRTVTASPVVEGDPIPKPDNRSDNRVVTASPVIEGDPMIPEDRISIEDLKAKLDGGTQVLILDLRSAEGWKAATAKIKGARHLSPEAVEQKMKDWKKAQEIIAYCACPDDATSLSVARTLKKAGFPKVKALWGGWQAWEQAGYPTEPK